MAQITESRPPVLGQQHSYSITPPPGLECIVTWFINGQHVTLRDRVGGLEVKGFGAAGQMTVEVVGNTDGTTVEARTDCPQQPTIPAGPIVVGSGSFDTCEQEPCKTSRQNYINAGFIALESELLVKLTCGVYKLFLAAVLIVFLYFLILLALSIVCHLAFTFPTLCVAIDILLLAVFAGLTVLMTRLTLLRLELQKLQRQCETDSATLRINYLRMQLNCPPDCWVPEIKVNCNC